MANDCRWSCAGRERHGGVLGPSRDKQGPAAQAAVLRLGSLTPGVNGCVAPSLPESFHRPWKKLFLERCLLHAIVHSC